jgi:hypothetical protein
MRLVNELGCDEVGPQELEQAKQKLSRFDMTDKSKIQNQEICSEQNARP